MDRIKDYAILGILIFFVLGFFGVFDSCKKERTGGMLDTNYVKAVSEAGYWKAKFEGSEELRRQQGALFDSILAKEEPIKSYGAGLKKMYYGLKMSEKDGVFLELIK